MYTYILVCRKLSRCILTVRLLRYSKYIKRLFGNQFALAINLNCASCMKKMKKKLNKLFKIAFSLDCYIYMYRTSIWSIAQNVTSSNVQFFPLFQRYAYTEDFDQLFQFGAKNKKIVRDCENRRKRKTEKSYKNKSFCMSRICCFLLVTARVQHNRLSLFCLKHRACRLYHFHTIRTRQHDKHKAFIQYDAIAVWVWFACIAWARPQTVRS